MAKRIRRSRLNGLLPTIGMILLASAVLRLGNGSAIAWAEMAQSTLVPASTTEPEDVSGLIIALKEREAAIDAREKDLARRLRAAEAAEETLRRKLETLAQAEASLSEKIRIAEVGGAEDVARLTDVYARMKPKQAAALFAEMEPDFAAGFLARMNADAAAAILAGMDPDAAYTISVVMAGRNVNDFGN